MGHASGLMVKTSNLGPWSDHLPFLNHPWTEPPASSGHEGSWRLGRWRSARNIWRIRALSLPSRTGNHGKIMGKSWENHGNIGRSWEHRKIMGKSWESHAKIGRSWENGIVSAVVASESHWFWRDHFLQFCRDARSKWSCEWETIRMIESTWVIGVTFPFIFTTLSWGHHCVCQAGGNKKMRL